MKKQVKEIKLGECPYCKTRDYNSQIDSWSDGSLGNYCIVRCDCKCGKIWTEYYSIDEVKFDKDGEEFIYNNTLGKADKEVLLKAMNLLIEEENDTQDYTNIINVLQGKLNEE